jgi:CheY-like chemotaxis protein
LSETRAGLLIVEGELSTRILLSQILARIGHRVRSAADGFAALREIRQDCPQILLSDLNMPGMSGFELLSIVRRRFPQIQVIAMSGAFSGHEVPSGFAADAFFDKGSSIPCLLRIMESLPNMQRMAEKPLASPMQGRISQDGKSDPKDTCVTIECPECLRTLPKVLKSTTGKSDERHCVYCGSMVRSSIVQTAERPRPLPSWREQNSEIPALGSRPNVNC